MNPPQAFFATCPKGLEYLLRDELKALGADDVREARAGVHFRGTLETALRACLWSRLASRILLPLTDFEAGDDAALYAGVQGIDWSGHLTADGTLAVDVTLAAGDKGHSRFLAQRVQDAVVDQFRARGQGRPDVDTEQPDIRLHLHLRHGRASL
ncbi:MAG TPA: THUMP domain-containing protein, partial [Rhodanobacteraceae bacterium]|nr:THUMP domain-containing protein [Rhodanobacteraceae bacterium]